MADSLVERQVARLDAAFLREQRRGVRLLAIARLITMVVILGWVLSIDVAMENLRPYVIVGLLSGLSLVSVWLTRTDWYRPWMLYPLVALDNLLIGYGLLGMATIGGEVLPPPVMLRSVWFSLFFLFIAGTALAQSPGLVVWAGLSAALVWTVGALWVMAQPGSYHSDLAYGGANTVGDFLAVYLDPMFVDVVNWGSQVLLLLLVAFVLAVVVGRSRRLVADTVAVERERANLARYFSPDMVDRLAAKDSPFAQPQTRPVAVLFADLMGFTRICETTPPPEVIELLRGFRQRMERCVFAHGGTIDKYVGDCVMATFGTVAATDADPAEALACARAMTEALRDWNRERRQRGEPALRLCIGLHYGPVILGDIGGDRQVEFTVIGDTVNVASRLEKITRDLDADIVASDDLVQAAVAVRGPQALDGFSSAESVSLRGRRETLGVWYHRRAEALAAE
ncbi:adenylate/guanylate cyclase domain-containing protein [Rhodocista pekingensis]|uniref:Adenylate/guanylate cyclase domain-containing protein n=1 Tax=Rhodocista pekingensis TaxID=201185 RepID=A0ABW2KRS3_9PROT